MPTRLCTISEAALLAGISRTTVQRWVKAGRLKKTKAGKVRFAAVERCKGDYRTGRPCGTREAGYEKLADKLAKPFLGVSGLQRLRGVINVIAREGGYRGKEGFDEKIQNALIQALSEFKEHFDGGRRGARPAEMASW